jgi:hypothetical protein
MKTYMLLLYANEQGGLSLPPDEMAKWMGKMGEYVAALEKADAFISTGGLGVTQNARTVHTEDGELKVHNGPYAETQEQLGGYYLIKARNMDEAQVWASKCPGAIWGHVEIREVEHGS